MLDVASALTKLQLLWQVYGGFKSLLETIIGKGDKKTFIKNHNEKQLQKKTFC